jgi:hypothetical protein
MHYCYFLILFKILAISHHLIALSVFISVKKVTFSLRDRDRCNMAV